MERAGAAVALEAVRLGAGYGSRVVVVTGPGNNGGDGYVAARHLRRRGVWAEVRAVAAPRTDACVWAARSAAEAGVPIEPIGIGVRGVDLIIDAGFGGGFRRGIPAALQAWVVRPEPVLAVDVPSGLDPDTGQADAISFRAAATVTFHSLKPGHLLGDGPGLCGDINVVDIGLEGGIPSLLLVGEGDAHRPERSRTAHKWSAGSVLVVGGNSGMVGAAVLAARSALHFGAGAVGVATNQPELVQTIAPELLAYPIDVVPQRYDVIVIGPGLGDDPDTVSRVVASERPLVVDADALSHIEGLAFESPVVLTPHAGEFERLTGDPPSPEAAIEAARATRSVLVLKGSPTIITDGGVPRVVASGDERLATIGTGDVLAGMIGALMARGMAPLDAATSAAYWHGRTATESSGETLTADALATRIGRHAWSRG